VVVSDTVGGSERREAATKIGSPPSIDDRRSRPATAACTAEEARQPAEERVASRPSEAGQCRNDGAADAEMERSVHGNPFLGVTMNQASSAKNLHQGNELRRF
jgi:hypothetical protein